MKKTLSAKILFILTIISWALVYIIGGIIGDALRLLAVILLLMTIIAFFRELSNKKAKK